VSSIFYHFNPLLPPQGDISGNAPWTGIMEDPKRFVVCVYTWITKRPISDAEMARVIQEFSYRESSGRFLAISTLLRSAPNG